MEVCPSSDCADAVLKLMHMCHTGGGLTAVELLNHPEKGYILQGTWPVNGAKLPGTRHTHGAPHDKTHPVTQQPDNSQTTRN